MISCPECGDGQLPGPCSVCHGEGRITHETWFDWCADEKFGQVVFP